MRLTESIFQNLKEDDEWKVKYEAKKKAEKEFAESIDPEPLFDKIREMVGDNSLQFKFELKEDRGQIYPKVTTDNVVDKCGIFQLAIKECYIGTFSTGIAFSDKDEEEANWSNPFWWGSIDLRYSSHGGGSNGMEILRFNYKKDGGWDFRESRER